MNKTPIGMPRALIHALTSVAFALLLAGTGCPISEIQKGESAGTLTGARKASTKAPPLNHKGDSFFPLGWYSHLDASVLPVMRAGGMNAVIPYSADKTDEQISRFMDAAVKESLNVLVEIGRKEVLAINSGKKDFRPILARVRNLMGKKNLLGWYLIDEPHLQDGKGISPSVCKMIYDSIKTVDPSHPVFIVDTQWGWTGQWDSDETKSYAIACDVAMWDEYPLMEAMTEMPAKIARVSETSRMTREVVGREGRSIPMMGVLQAYGIKDKKAKENYAAGDGNRRRNPTFDELRYMAYSSIIHGCRGLFFWVYYRADSQVENHVHSVVQDLHANQIPDLACRPDPGKTVLAEEVDEDGDREQLDDVHHLLREKDGLYFLLVSNDADRRIGTVSFTFDSSLAVSSVVTLNQGKEGKVPGIRGNAFTDALGPFEVKLYRVKVQ